MASRNASWWVLVAGMAAGAALPDSWAAAPGPLEALMYVREGRARRSSSHDPDWRDGNNDRREIAPGQTLVIADLQGPGVIQHIWLTIHAADPFYPRSVVLRAFWDGAAEPAVEAPLGDFFAVGNGLRATVQSAAVEVSSEGRAYNCFWPMPFQRSARIEVSNDSGEHAVHSLYWYVDWVALDRLPEGVANFHAQYRQEYPARAGEDYLILDATGRGHYVGTVLSVWSVTDGWPGEGDDRFYIDGEAEPSLNGTGTEDYFGDAWGFRPFNHLYHGVTVWEGYRAGDRGTAYRWHIADPIPFARSLRVTIEHKGAVQLADGSWNGFLERPDLVSSVAFWYQQGPAKRYAELPAAGKRLPAALVIEGESLLDSTATEPPGFAQIQTGGYSGGKHLWLVPAAAGGVARVPFDIAAAGRYVVQVDLTCSWDYGRWQVSLDGQALAAAPVDLCQGEIGVLPVRVGVSELAAGRHELVLECVGTTAASRGRETGEPGYFGGLDAIRVWRLPEAE